VWHFLAEVEWDGNATGTRDVEIHQNGTAIARSNVTPNAADTCQQTSAVVFNPAAGDVFSVVVTQNSGGNLNVETISYFKGFRVSANG